MLAGEKLLLQGRHKIEDREEIHQLELCEAPPLDVVAFDAKPGSLIVTRLHE